MFGGGGEVIVTNMFGFEMKRLRQFNTNNILKSVHLHNSWVVEHCPGGLGTSSEICATSERICATIFQ